MDFSFLSQYCPFFLEGAKLTLILAFFTVLFGSIIGLFLSLMRLSNSKILKTISTVYVEFIRGTPMLVQIFIIYYSLPSIGIELPDMTAGILALSINSSAYVAEIIRAGIQAVDKGQMEASRSLGMSYGQTMLHIIIPQAFKNILPALGNEFIVVIKESSIVSMIGLHDLMYNANIVRGNIFRPFEPLLVAALIYFIMTFTLSKLLGLLERRLKAYDQGM
ncbi:MULTISPECIES: amino acid ABC transporter permease [Clostridium]|uniref:Amino acid ABC transporter membrane protein, PAAT family n=1 Tax=Clostridium cadaveris TaxID=1529 RepID=A0A1I2NY24_9CLOT|nr:amino acid ABC transporter permease [Clostridium cadaveris]MDU4951747.1 amino acid ABC transporter permease [Clostridium sp.]MDM8312651.1 amino acid ABC transporter permease [Clostridium cadaveris]MDY4949386.1 amino acid ABC transporter permease [Clostridium cadaveris]NME64759.1 amino acid ABC transporter permease [Clostridium cadaveris]NWK12364.1 amino acid ABC transporter permease [Clostridium cadaveris]